MRIISALRIDALLDMGISPEWIKVPENLHRDLNKIAVNPAKKQTESGDGGLIRTATVFTLAVISGIAGSRSRPPLKFFSPYLGLNWS